jgi:hypothetical protein
MHPTCEPEFGCEQSLDLLVRDVSIEQRHEFLRGVPLIHVQDEQTATVAGKGTSRSL